MRRLTIGKFMVHTIQLIIKKHKFSSASFRPHYLIYNSLKKNHSILISNTYNVLLTRGMRGTYIYCEDKILNEFLKSLISSN